MLKKLLQFLFLILFYNFCLVQAQEPKKLLYIMGGGGEPQGSSTIFDSNLSLISHFVEKADWETTVSFNGGHSDTENIIKQKLKNARNVGSFNEENYNLLVKDMIDKIKNGQLKNGDQLMVTINSHGAKKLIDEKTHRISLASSEAKNLQTLEGSSTVSLDSLEELANLASKNGVKLAIIDSSCFSGNLLNIKNNDVCLISAAGRDQYGYAGNYVPFLLGNYTNSFTSELFNSLKKGRNLEEIFLKARKVGPDPDFPMISTPEGKALNELLYRLIAPYLNFTDNKVDDFGAFYSKSNQDLTNSICSAKNNFDQLEIFLTQLSKIKSAADESTLSTRSDFLKLKDALVKYRNLQLEYEQSLKNLFEAKKEIQAILSRDYPKDTDFIKEINPIDLLTIDFSDQINYWTGVYDDSRKKNSEEVLFLTGVIDTLKKRNKMSFHVKIFLSEQARKHIEDHVSFLKRSNNTFALARDVAYEAKRVYDQLYDEIKDKKSNPCRDFVL